VNALILAMMMEDFESMAEAMLSIGVTRKTVNTRELAKDLENLYNAEENLAENYPPTISGDGTEPDQFLLEIVRIAEVHGIRFPREFTLLLKQLLYFDSYADLFIDMDDFMDDMTLNFEKPGRNSG